ncbi:MAG: DMT family transporter [Shewanella sp.]|nr:DMT family transporter [Shewanella sp.]MCF1429868.1 DMT family transporter [Shewanella sp.]MCF1439940.1 DMT family transporter [Shewanella sp.]MCF1457822.1 DMT family transporter [Shewanella sp.]
MLNQEHKVTLRLVLTSMIAALGWIISKETIVDLPPFGFIGLRFTLASLCLLPLCYRPLRRTKGKDIHAAAGVGLLLGAGRRVILPGERIGSHRRTGIIKTVTSETINNKHQKGHDEH